MGRSIKRLKSEVYNSCQCFSKTSLANKSYQPIAPVKMRSEISSIRQYDMQLEKEAPLVNISRRNVADGLSQRLYDLSLIAPRINTNWPINQIGNPASLEKLYEESFDMTGHTTLSTIPWNTKRDRNNLGSCNGLESGEIREDASVPKPIQKKRIEGTKFQAQLEDVELQPLFARSRPMLEFSNLSELNRSAAAPEPQAPRCHLPFAVQLAANTGTQTTRMPRILQTTQTIQTSQVPSFDTRITPLETLLHGAVAELQHPNCLATAYTIRHEALLRGAIAELESLKRSMGSGEALRK